MDLDASLTFVESIKQQPDIEKILLFHEALDVSYIVTAFYLKKNVKHSFKHQDRLKGYSHSPVLQPSIRSLFDATIYLIQAGSHEPIEKLLEHAIIAPGSIFVALNF